MAEDTTDRRPDPHGDAQALLAGYALHALDEDERRAVDQMVASDAGSRRTLDEYQEVVAAFAVEAEPPADLRADVLERVRNTPQVDTSTVSDRSTAGRRGVPGSVEDPARTGAVVDLDAARHRRRRWGFAVAAAAAAVAIAVPTVVAVRTASELDRARSEVQAVSEMLGDPQSVILRGDVEGGGTASVLVADDDMLFRADGLSELDEGRAYQLWVVASDGSVSSAGLLALEGDQATSLVQGTDGVGMAVSIEPDTGSQQPTTTPIVVLSS